MTSVLTSNDYVFMFTHEGEQINIKYVKPGECHYTYIYEFKTSNLSDWSYIPVMVENKIYFRGLMIDPINHTFTKQHSPTLTFPKHIKLEPKAILKDVQSKYYITETPFIKYEIRRLDNDELVISFKSDQFINYERVLLCGDYALLKCFQFIPGVDYIKELYNCTGSVFGYDIIRFE